MEHQLEYHAAVDGKHPANKPGPGISAHPRRLIFAAVAFFAASVAASSSYAQSSAFAGMAGNWAGGGTVTLEDGSSERIRCRATYTVGGNTMNMNLICASDAYKFNLQASVVAQGGAISGNWIETSRNVAGNLQGRGAGGNFQVVASGPGFDANISLRTAGNRQSVAIRADSQFRSANISMSR